MTQLTKLKKEDTDEIVAIHCIAFPGYFLTDLGKDVLRVFYETLIQDKFTIVWGVKEDQALVGFFVASTAPIGLYTRLFQKHFFRFLVPLSISFLKNISLLYKMIISVNSSKSIIVPSSYPTSLLSICVSQSYAGKGIGKMLLGKLENELVLKEQKGYYLTTDSDNNEATNNFYLSNCFQLHEVFSQGKRRMNIYIKDLK